MGLIDILTQYDAKKKAAHAAKTVKHGVSFPKPFLSCNDYSLGRELLCLGWQREKNGLGWVGGQGMGKVLVWTDTLIHISSHRRGQRSLLSIQSSMQSDSSILLLTSLPKSLPDLVVIVALYSKGGGLLRGLGELWMFWPLLLFLLC